QQKEKFLPKLTNGTFIGGQALTEPNHGSDVFGMKTTATKCKGGYLLNGHKWLVGLAPIADVAVVYASTNPQLGRWGISAFLVEKDREGYTATKALDKMGLRTIPTGELIFENCFVPFENLLGNEGSGFGIINYSMEYDRCTIFSSQLGAMERQLEQTIQYTQSRNQFGQPIGKFQAVSNRIADMKLRLETAKLLLYKTAWLMNQGKSTILDSSLLKLYLSESFVDSRYDAVRVHGGVGYLTNHGVERNLRDAIGGVIYAGTSDIQRNIIAQYLGI
ncbi:MAG: acyl-CoA dehydrogenase, partial [Bacteroidota bacterium]